MIQEYDISMDGVAYNCLIEGNIEKDIETDNYWMDIDRFEVFEFKSGKKVKDINILKKLETACEEKFSEDWFLETED